jgi:hypothetical protein
MLPDILNVLPADKRAAVNGKFIKIGVPATTTLSGNSHSRQEVATEFGEVAHVLLFSGALRPFGAASFFASPFGTSGKT